MIKACIMAFNDDSFIQWTLSSLIGYVDEIIAVVGSFKNFSNQFICSDGTIDILEKFGVRVFVVSNLTQLQQRNLVLKKLNNNDWYLMIDCDETLYNGAWLNTLDEREHDRYSLPFFQHFRIQVDNPYLPLLKVINRETRLVKKTGRLYFHKRHFLLFRDEECIWFSDSNAIAESSMVHWLLLRNKKRLDLKLKFYKNRHRYKTECHGFYGWFLYNTCWEDCKYYFGDKHFNCINEKGGKCQCKDGVMDSSRMIRQYPVDPKAVEVWIR